MRERHIHAAIDCIKKGNISWLIRQIYKAIVIPISQGIKRPICGPIEGIITPTYRCNSDCIMCNLKKRGNKSNELSIEEWHKVIDDMVVLGVSGIGISGGEPLLSKNTIPLVKYITQKKLPVHISTNGFLINDTIVEQLINAGLGSIAISIDSANPDINDKLRGIKNAFVKALEGVKTVARVRARIKNSNLRLTVASVISRESISHCFDLIALISQAGADTISFLPVMTSGIVTDKQERINKLIFKEKDCTHIDVDKFIKNLIVLKKNKKVIDNSVGFLNALKSYFQNKPFPATCFAGYAVCVVDADGNVFPCFDFLERNKSIGNIRQMSLIDLWHSNEYNKMRSITAKCRDCYLTCHQEFNLLYKFTGNLLAR